LGKEVSSHQEKRGSNQKEQGRRYGSPKKGDGGGWMAQAKGSKPGDRAKSMGEKKKKACQKCDPRSGKKRRV